MIYLPKIRILFLSSVFIVCGFFCVGQNKNADSDSRGVQQFTAQFYDWYVKAALDADGIKLLDTKEMHRALAPELLQAIKQDYDAQARDKTGHIVG
jgi:hypothetical protein